MHEPDVVTIFGYRAPRALFPLSLQVAITRAGAGHAIGVHGIDISATGIAIAVDEQLSRNESVELAIQSGEGELARIPGRVFYQSDDHYGLAFEFSSEEQVQQVQDLISRLVKTVGYLREPRNRRGESKDPGDLDRIHGRPKI
jgi:hypothetical protein